MANRIAIIQCADTGPLESLVIMLRVAGYDCYLPSVALQGLLKSIGCDTVLSVGSLVRDWGYDPPFDLPEASPSLIRAADLYVDIKAHRSYDKVVTRWPTLGGKVLWYRINGGKPEIVPGCGDEVNPPCPVLTPNQWYGKGWIETTPIDKTEGWVTKDPAPWSYSCWPPFHRFDDYTRRKRWSQLDPSRLPTQPICLIHNINGWGYQDLVPVLRDRAGLKCYGVRSPDGMVRHCDIPNLLANTLAMVHLKSSDAPGYAIYECLAAGCPLVCTKRLIWRCRMGELLEDSVTCLTFDRETHDPLSPQDVEDCTTEVQAALAKLTSAEYNSFIGRQGRERLQQLMWRPDRDGPGFTDWMRRHFP